MTIYCKAGQTARITLVPAKILEFPGPVEVLKRPDISTDCIWVEVKYAVDVLIGTSSANVFNGQAGAYSPIGGLRISPTDRSQVQIFGRLNSCAEASQWRNWVRFSVFAGTIGNPRVIETIAPAQKGIVIKNIEGTILYQDGTTTNQAVQCIGCPTGTLDCNDCCLDCASIFNRISDIRKLLASKL